MRRLVVLAWLVVSLLGSGLCAPLAYAQSATTTPAVTPDGLNDVITYVKAQTVEVISQSVKEIPGTNTSSQYQTITARLLDGPDAGQTIRVDNDYLMMKPD